MIYHVGVHNAGNAGDVVILSSVNNLIKQIDKSIVNVIDVGKQPAFNAPIFVGGGGLFIRYEPTSKLSKTSGWRWNISLQKLKEINQPIVVFAVGFNKFRGQIEYDPIFSEHLKTLVEKSAFFSLREKSGIDRLKPYIGDLTDKVRYQPCPVSFCGRLFGDAKRNDGYTVFAPAMDRVNLRGDIKKIIPVLKTIPNLKIALHMAIDEQFMQYVNFPSNSVKLWGKPTNEVLHFYRGAKQVIGMRLHSCLIPFGLGISTIPLISHDKLADWLKDINHPEWGVELENSQDVKNHLDKNQIDISIRDELYKITMNNLDELRRVI